MKNKEKFRDEIVELAINNKSIAVSKKTGCVVACGVGECSECLFDSNRCSEQTVEWAEKEYVPIVDWSTVPVGEEILVRDGDYEAWSERKFAFVKDGAFYCYLYMETTDSDLYFRVWKQAKLKKE